MSYDTSREQIVVVLTCARCGDKLTVCSDKERTRVAADSAYEIRPTIAVNPCARCEARFDEVAKAVDLLAGLGKEKRT